MVPGTRKCRIPRHSGCSLNVVVRHPFAVVNGRSPMMTAGSRSGSRSTTTARWASSPPGRLDPCARSAKWFGPGNETWQKMLLVAVNKRPPRSAGHLSAPLRTSLFAGFVCVCVCVCACAPRQISGHDVGLVEVRFTWCGLCPPDHLLPAQNIITTTVNISPLSTVNSR